MTADRRPILIDAARRAGVPVACVNLMLHTFFCMRKKAWVHVRARLADLDVAEVVGNDEIDSAAQPYASSNSVRSDFAGFGRRSAATIPDWLEPGIVAEAEYGSPVNLMIGQSSQTYIE